MATNPMQRKSRNSFLGGMLVMLVIALLIGAVLYVFVVDKKQESTKGKEVQAYVLNQSVKSGDRITSAMVTPIKTYETFIPGNYIDASYLANMEAEDTSKRIIAKVSMEANTILTTEMITTSENSITNDVRLVEFNMLTLPTGITVGDYIDIRLTLPNGQDLIVVSKKQIKTLQGDTVGLFLSEGDIIMMTSATVEAYIITASNLYAIQYVEAGMQTAAIQTYTPTAEVQALISGDPNIVQEAKTALAARFSNVRGYIDGTRAEYLDEQKENLEAGIQEQIEKAKQAREDYLTGLQSITM